ncbi:hypothetical protein B0H17DRAFT_1265365, partial [Mycena rosella]
LARRTASFSHDLRYRTLTSSPFASKLGTNYAPKDDEMAEIHALLVDPTRQLEHLDAKIAAVRNTLDKLTAA